MIYIKEYELVASGEKWIGEGVKSSFNVISNLIEGSFNDLVLTIYIIQDYKIWNLLKSTVNRGVRVEIFMYDNPDENFKGFYDEILEYSKGFPNLIVHEITDKEKIHSKVIIADKSKVYLGSANLTYNGLNFNYELGIVVNDNIFASKLSHIIRKLIM